MENNTFTPNPKQREFLALTMQADCENCLLFGGSRGGKSAAMVLHIWRRANHYPGTRHGIFRHTLKACTTHLGPVRGTFQEVINKISPGYFDLPGVVVSKSEHFIKMHNGSEIVFEGLDEERVENALGTEYATVWINECNSVPDYDVILQLSTRMANKAPLVMNGKVQNDAQGNPIMIRPQMLFDCNPRVESDWEHKLFIEKVDPISGAPLERPDAYKALQVDSADNSANQSAGYLDTLAMRLKSRPMMFDRFIKGWWSKDNPNAMFKPVMIERGTKTVAQRDELTRVLVAVDPNAADNKKANLTGIIVVGLDRFGKAYVLEDLSCAGPADKWALEAVKAYARWDADYIVAEANNGGTMVEATIKSQDRNAPVKLVKASKGKLARAEPIAIEYNKGRVFHSDDLKELESEMFDFEAIVNSPTKSPDRVDALVWGLSELLRIGAASRGFHQGSTSGVWR